MYYIYLMIYCCILSVFLCIHAKSLPKTYHDSEFPPEDDISTALANGTNFELNRKWYEDAVRRLTQKAYSDECKAKITNTYHLYLKALSYEAYYPYETTMFHTQCPGAHNANAPLGISEFPEAPVYDSPPAVKDRLEPESLSILYVLLVHDYADFVTKIVEALDEPQHTFVIHVDLKAEHIQSTLKHYYEHVNIPTTLPSELDVNVDGMQLNSSIEYETDAEVEARSLGGGVNRNVYVMEQGREACNWGGFTIVNATLNAMKFALDHDVKFDYCMDVSGTSYPIKSKEAIKRALAEKPGGIYMDVVSEPQIPQPDMWNHFVECDNAVHRIARMTMPHGINLHVASQWFSIPHHFVEWLIRNPLPRAYMDYAKSYIVADENYFGSMVLNSPYCHDVIKKNHVLLLFDKWENELKSGKHGQKDQRKCLNPYRDHCGRSPTALTLDDLSIVKSSRMLFARKFDPLNPGSMELVKKVEEWRMEEEIRYNSSDRHEGSHRRFMMRVIPKRSNISNPDDLYFGVHRDLCVSTNGMLAGKMTLSQCDAYNEHQWFYLDQCHGNAHVYLRDGQVPVLYPEFGVDISKEFEPYSVCQIVLDGSKLCLDINGQNYAPGADLIGWECTGNWNQLFKLTYNGLLLASMPKSLRRIRSVSEGSMEALCAQNVLRNGQRQVVLADCAALGKENLHNAQMRREMMANGTYVEGSYPPVDFGYIHYNSILKGGGYETLYMNK